MKSQDRYNKFSTGYVVDKWIFRVGAFLIFGWLFFVAYYEDFDLDYFECVAPENMVGTPCENPFYKPVTWKNVEVLEPGVYGKKPGLLFESVFYVPILVLVLAFACNHWIYNKGKKMVKPREEWPTLYLCPVCSAVTIPSKEE